MKPRSPNMEPRAWRRFLKAILLARSLDWQPKEQMWVSVSHLGMAMTYQGQVPERGYIEGHIPTVHGCVSHDLLGLSFSSCEWELRRPTLPLT